MAIAGRAGGPASGRSPCEARPIPPGPANLSSRICGVLKAERPPPRSR